MQIGQHVVLVDDRWTTKKDKRIGVRYPERGVVYTVRNLFDGITVEGEAITLQEIVNPVVNYRFRDGSLKRLERRFAAFRFKPLAKLKVEDFADVREPA